MHGSIRLAPRRGLVLASAVLVGTALLGGCGKSDDVTSEATTTTTAAPADITTTTDAATTTGGSASAADAWDRSATDHRGEDGTEVDFDCPAGGTLRSVWGTETYTDDSSVCTAGVHVGLITVADGGTVTIEMQPGADSYEAGEANGVTSQYYGAYEGSFTFPDAPPGSGEFTPPASSWARSAAGLEVGESRTVDCSGGGPASSVWGTGTYTADSSICTAAVLEGLITLEDGGKVAVEVVEGLDAYTGSEANGITSQDYPAYPLAFEFPEAQPAG